ncbi:MAG: 2-dehydropantoate 2-reductase [Rhodoglobus sp.]
MSAPRIAVVGTGANGGGIGADLTRAGHDVTFIEQWPDHVEAMRRDGIRVELPDEVQVTPVRVMHLCEVATIREPFDLVLIVVKAYDTRWACELIRPLLHDESVVVGVQNGMSIDDVIDIVGPDRALGAVIEISANMFTPGVVERQSPRSKSWFAVGGTTPAAQARAAGVAAVLSAAGTVEVSDDIRSSKWMKLVVNAAELVPSAILGLPLGDAVRVPGMRDFMARTGREAIHACLSAGHQVRPIFGMADARVDDPDAYADQLIDAVLMDYTLPTTRTTVLQDWMKGRRSEVSEINGLVVEVLTASHAPLNARVVELAGQIESGRLTADPANAALLLDVLSTSEQT